MREHNLMFWNKKVGIGLGLDWPLYRRHKCNVLWYRVLEMMDPLSMIT